MRAAADARSAEAIAARALSKTSDDCDGVSLLKSLTGTTFELLTDCSMSLLLKRGIVLGGLGARRRWDPCSVLVGVIGCAPLEGDDWGYPCLIGTGGNDAQPHISFDPP